jgi:TetR/AcrR family transcriptional repressor of nem operon
MSKAISTRLSILQKAFELTYRQGFQTTSVDDIIAHMNVTKGAFFYHFKNKEEMGIAMVNEIMYTGMKPYMLEALSKTDDVLSDIYGMISALLLSNSFFDARYGCPAVNIADEMAPINGSFKKAVIRLMVDWQAAIEKALTGAKELGQIDKSHDVKQIALYITASYSGIRNAGKLFGKSCYKDYLAQFKIYLNSLK